MHKNERTEPYSFPPTSGALEDCPVCGSDDVGHNQGVTIETDCLRLRAECRECKSTWREVFTLNLIDDVRVSDRYRKQQETRAAYTRETLQRAYAMYESGCTHSAVTEETGLDRESAEWISSRQLAGLGLPPASPGAVAGGKLGTSYEPNADPDESNAMENKNTYFGVCPVCHKHDGYINLGKDHWYICITHKKKWCIGANLFSSAMDETPEQQEREQEQLGFESFEVVEPFYGEPDANTDRD